MTTNQFGRNARRVCYLIAAGALVSRAAFATEAKGDLSLELRVVDTVVSKGALGKPASGVARIEVVLDSFRDAHDVVLRLERPDGLPLTFRSRPVDAGLLTWRDARGAGVTPGARGIVIPARGRILTRLEVPLEGAALHPIVVKATARAGAQEVKTEGFVFVPVGVPRIVVEEDPETGIANFPVQVVN